MNTGKARFLISLLVLADLGLSFVTLAVFQDLPALIRTVLGLLILFSLFFGQVWAYILWYILNGAGLIALLFFSASLAIDGAFPNWENPTSQDSFLLVSGGILGAYMLINLSFMTFSTSIKTYVLEQQNKRKIQKATKEE
jgi:hypothetical protein